MKGYVNENAGTWHRLRSCAGAYANRMESHKAKEDGYCTCDTCARGGWDAYAPEI